MMTQQYWCSRCTYNYSYRDPEGERRKREGGEEGNIVERERVRERERGVEEQLKKRRDKKRKGINRGEIGVR